MTVIGIQKGVNFTIDDRKFSGINLFCAVARDNVVGHATEKLFISAEKDCFSVASGLKVGDEFTCYYNRYGKVETIVPVK